jgi:hypothetical protein
MRRIRFIITCLSMFGKLYAPVAVPSSINRFNNSIIKSPFAVAYLYDSAAICSAFDAQEQRSCRKERQEHIKQNSTIMRSSSKDGRYMNADINFLLVNLQKSGLCKLRERYNLSDSDNFLFFYKGKLLPKSLTGPIDRADLEQLIEDHWHEEINGILAEKLEEHKRRLAEERASYSYYGMGPYWGYPYSWGCPWNGCYAPITGGYFSVGFSSGCGWC